MMNIIYGKLINEKMITAVDCCIEAGNILHKFCPDCGRLVEATTLKIKKAYIEELFPCIEVFILEADTFLIGKTVVEFEVTDDITMIPTIRNDEIEKALGMGTCTYWVIDGGYRIEYTRQKEHDQYTESVVYGRMG